MKYQIGMIGLGVMGKNLALNMERKGISVACFDRDLRQREEAEKQIGGKRMAVFNSLEALVEHLETPRRIWMMVPAGKAVDALIKELLPLVQKGDLLIDGGNSFFLDTERRYKTLKSQGILFIGTGVSGGEEGALYGPSLMPGGNPEAWPLVKSIFTAIAAKTDDGQPCAAWVGEGGAGHFVKMVHNGIEYADMQMISESYFLMERLLGMRPGEMAVVFDQWNKGELNSYLIKITARILSFKDKETGKPMVDVILDAAGQKGTGKWTSQTALDLGIPAQTIAEAVFARGMSALKEERVRAAKILGGAGSHIKLQRTEFTEQIRQALYAAKICAYAQGFQLMRAASSEYGWELRLGNIASLWRAGCIIRAQFLDKIKRAFGADPALKNLLLDSYFRETINRNQAAWRNVIVQATKAGLPVPAFSSALAYYDAYRTERLPANLLQAQRDYFGAHTYERIDKPRGHFFHTRWD